MQAGIIVQTVGSKRDDRCFLLPSATSKLNPVNPNVSENLSE
jgi:hypothetical protein